MSKYNDSKKLSCVKNNTYFIYFLLEGGTPGSSQQLLLDLYLEVTPGSALETILQCDRSNKGWPHAGKSPPPFRPIISPDLTYILMYLKVTVGS